MQRLDRVLDRKLLKSSGIVGTGTLISEILGFLFLLIIVRFYSKSDWGSISYTINVGTLIATIVVAGYPSALVRYIAKYLNKKEKIDEYFSNIIIIILGLFLVVIIGTVIIYNFNIGIISIVIGYSIVTIYLNIIRGFIQYKKIALFQVIRNLVKVFVLLSLSYVFYINSPTLIILLYAFGGWVAILILELARPVKIRYSFALVSKKIIREVTLFSIPVTISMFMYTALRTVPVIIIKLFYDYDVVGLYTAAFTLTAIFGFVPMALVTITMPKISNIENKKSRVKYTTQSFWLVLLTGVAGYILIVLVGRPIIEIVLTEKYVMSFPILLVLSIGAILAGLRNVFCSLWEGSGRPIIATIDLTVATGVCIAFSFLLIPSIGYIGAAYGYSIGLLVAVLIDVVYWIRYRYTGKLRLE